MQDIQFGDNSHAMMIAIMVAIMVAIMIVIINGSNQKQAEL